MDISHILSACDHTLLSQTARWEDIKNLCDEGLEYGCASVCIPPSYVKQAAEYLNGRLPVCTVIGFPNGYSTAAVKCFEARDAIENGAQEIDMVINLGLVKDGLFSRVEDEIRAVKAACHGHILKVIVEACMLTEDEKIRLCRAVTDAGADFIKTSTGFGGGGATLHDVELFREHIGKNVRIKAAGGIPGPKEAAELIEAGASRIGTSRVVKAVKSASGNC